jgi:predicted nuclease of predicted toxin-antitoxin system
VKILLDESVPRLLKLRLPQFDISTVQELGWAGIRNGELLGRAAAQFDVLVTADQNLRYQQNLSGRKLAILVLPSNQVPVVTQLLPQVETTLATIQPSSIIEIPSPRGRT